jgi:hypothetical protein
VVTACGRGHRWPATGTGGARSSSRAAFASELHTAGLGPIERRRAGIDDLRQLTAAAGRDPHDVDVQVKGPSSRVRLDDWDHDGHLQVLS